ncbi:hypothetical protein [Streptomyces zaomyceticus]|uniref:hypothetical protein n=1 Tax=Streptomyces zaomyceticus TaxID=68286 RepID=UPI0034332930
MSESSDPVMEAFGELAIALGHTATIIGWPAVKALFHLLDVHAHELAETIRNSPELRGLTDDHMSDCEAAADLIDREVRK